MKQIDKSIVNKVDALRAKGDGIHLACKKLGVSNATYYKYKAAGKPRKVKRAKKVTLETLEADMEDHLEHHIVVAFMGPPESVIEAVRGML